eukprot:1158325-Pelagomonas_calceolata.AAC.16
MGYTYGVRKESEGLHVWLYSCACEGSPIHIIPLSSSGEGDSRLFEPILAVATKVPVTKPIRPGEQVCSKRASKNSVFQACRGKQ